MELLIVAGIGLLGYKLSDSSKPPRTKRRRAVVPMTADDSDVPALMEADRRMAVQRWDQALDPRTTGIITPGTQPSAWMPFFKSERKQNTNDVVKQTRMELFTGALHADVSKTGTYRHKRELQPLFKPSESAAAVTSSGSTGNAPMDVQALQQRMGLTNRQNNVVPATQIRVGPGVGAGVDVVAQGGFHPMYRVTPTAEMLGAHRRNLLRGEINPGANPVSKRGADVDMTTKDNPRFWTTDERPLEQGRAAVLAASRQPLSTGTTGRMVIDGYVGGASGSGGVATISAPTRDRSDAHPTAHVTNVTGAASGPATFVEQGFDFRTEQQRGHGETTGLTALSGTAGGGAPAHAVAPNFDVSSTLRESSDTTYVGQAVGTRQRVSAPGTASSKILRDHPEQFGAGPTATGVKNPAVISVDLQKQRKRTEVSYVTGPQRINEHQNTLGDSRMRPHNPTDRMMSHGKDLVGTFAPQLGEVRQDLNKLPAANPLLADLGLGTEQLRDNPLALSII